MGLLPPSSSPTGLRLDAADNSKIFLPVEVDPVKLTYKTNELLLAKLGKQNTYLVNVHVPSNGGTSCRTKSGHYVELNGPSSSLAGLFS